MGDFNSMQRRRFLTLFGTVSSAALLPGTFGRALAETSSPARSGYGHGIMIDSLGSPGTNIDSVDPPLTDAEIEDVRASGLTAINLTVGAQAGYNDPVLAIAYWNAEIAAHPDVFLQVRHAADIAEAKRSGRVGLIMASRMRIRTARISPGSMFFATSESASFN
jgi:membrane dipeptidase